jgi:hypothetical protein
VSFLGHIMSKDGVVVHLSKWKLYLIGGDGNIDGSSKFLRIRILSSVHSRILNYYITSNSTHHKKVPYKWSEMWKRSIYELRKRLMSLLVIVPRCFGIEIEFQHFGTSSNKLCLENMLIVYVLDFNEKWVDTMLYTNFVYNNSCNTSSTYVTQLDRECNPVLRTRSLYN